MSSSVKDRLARQATLLGLLQTQENPALAEMAGMCGYDFVLVDCEHGVFSQDGCLQTLRALSAADVLAFVRVSGRDAHDLGRYMDMGFDAIVVSGVATGEQAGELARAMLYPPLGTRGFGAPAHRSTRYGADLPQHLQSPRRNTCLFPLIESAEGIANVERILAVEGVDGIFVGPSDLSASLGALRDFAQPAFVQALTRVEQAARRSARVLGGPPHAGATIEELFARGYRVFILGADMPLIREAMSVQISQAKSALHEVRLLPENS